MAISIILNGKETSVTKQELFELARRGIIKPDTEINVNGQVVLAGRVQGIVFGGADVQQESYEILLHGITTKVTKPQLQTLAAQGVIGADSPVTVNGKLVTAGMIDGIDFGIIVTGNTRQSGQEHKPKQQQQKSSEHQEIHTPANAEMIAEPAKRLLAHLLDGFLPLGILLLIVIVNAVVILVRDLSLQSWDYHYWSNWSIIILLY